MALTSALSSMPSFTAKLLKGQQGEGGCSTSWNAASGLGKRPAPPGAGLRGRLSCSSASFGARKPNLCPESQPGVNTRGYIHQVGELGALITALAACACPK